MAKFLSGREPYFNVGIESATEDLTSFSVVGNSYFTGIITASQFAGDGSLLTGVVASGVGITITDDNVLVGSAFEINFGQGVNVTPVNSGIVTIFSSYAPVAGISSYAEVAGVSTYASIAGLATYAEVAGVSTYASVAGLATYASSSGIATYASVAGLATYSNYATSSGIATYAFVSGISTYASSSGLSTFSNYASIAGISTYAQVSGISTYSSFSGIATYSSISGLSTYSSTAGIATYASSAGIASLAVGFGTTSSINTTGIITASRFVGDGSGLSSVIGISSQWVTNSAGIHTLSKVGIGTTNPLYNLHVNGEVVVSGGTSTTQHIKIKGYEQDGGALSFEGSSGQLLSISNNLTGDIFGVNDISGTPIILANSNGRVVLSPYSGNVGLGTTNPTSKLHVIGNGLFSGVVTATRYFGDGSQLTGISAGLSTYASIAGVATYAQTAGIATYAQTAGIATYSQTSGIATYASVSGVSTYAQTAGIATYATRAGVSTYALLAGISTIARTLDIDSSVFTSGIITASKFIGDGSSLTGIATVLDGISDVNITAIQAASDGRALIYQNGEWVSGPVIGGYSYNTSDPYINNVSLLMHMNGSNGSTTFIDSGANSGINTITVVGNTQISTAQSKFGGASAYFDGSGDYINIQDNPNFQFGTGDFTIECWFNATGLLNSYPTLLGNGNPSFSGSGSTGSWYFMVSGSPRKINVGTNTTNPIISSTTTINTGSWYHVALVRSGSSVYLFVNGALEAITTNTQSLNISNNGLRIGSNGWDGSQAFWYGYIDDVRVTKGIARYTSSFTLPTVAYPDPTDTNFNDVSLLLHMDGSNGSTTFTDSSSNNLTVTPNGNVAISTAQSKFGGASAYFDGSGDFLTVNSNNAFTLDGDFTIEFWLYVNTMQTSGLISNGASSFTGTAFVIVLDHSTQTNRLSIWNAPSTGTALCSTGTLITGTWYHAAFVRSGSTVTAYLNGVAGTTATTSATFTTSASNLRIGRYWNGDFDGYIDDLRITKGIARYTSNFTPQNYPFPNSVGVSTSLGYVINNLDDVDTFTTAPANGQSLIWDASNSVWKPSSVLYSSSAGIATYAQTAGIATYSNSSGVSTYSPNAGIATYANNAGIATYSNSSGVSTYSPNAGIATYSQTSGIATNTIGGIVDVTNLNVSGISTIGIVSATQINTVGVITALKFIGDGSLLTGVIPSSSTGINISNNNVNVGVALTINFGRNLTVSQASVGIVTVTTSLSSPTGVSRNTTSFIATNGQTLFSTTYNVGQIDVFLNGIRLSETEYVADNGTSITLNEGAALDDLLEVVSNQILFIPFGDYGDFSSLVSDAFGSAISPTFDALSDPGPTLAINDLGELS